MVKSGSTGSQSGQSGARVKLNSVSFRYPGRKLKSETILNGINLAIQAGEFISIIGPSGSGKSTLLRLLAGLDQPTSGEISFESENQIRRGFVFQEPRLLPWMNVLENVMLPLNLEPLGLDSESVKKTKDQITSAAITSLEKVKLGGALKKMPSELSGGMKMRASVARALVFSPNLLLLDEPFSAVDERTRHELQFDLRALWRSSTMTIVFVTHSVLEAVYLSDRVIALSNSPASISKEIKLNLPHDRTKTLWSDSEFNLEYQRILQELSPLEIL